MKIVAERRSDAESVEEPGRARLFATECELKCEGKANINRILAAVRGPSKAILLQNHTRSGRRASRLVLTDFPPKCIGKHFGVRQD